MEALEQRLDAIERTSEDVAARCAQVREAWAEDERREHYRRGYDVIVRETSTPGFGQRLGDLLTGPTPATAQAAAVRETSAAEPQPNMWVRAMQALFDGDPATRRPLSFEDVLAIQRIDEGARATRPARQASAEDRRMVDGFEHTCLRGGLGPAAR
jgi:hypothetical protein